MSVSQPPYLRVEYNSPDLSRHNGRYSFFYFGEDPGQYFEWLWRFVPEANATFLVVRGPECRVEIPITSIRNVTVNYKAKATSGPSQVNSDTPTQAMPIIRRVANG